MSEIRVPARLGFGEDSSCFAEGHLLALSSHDRRKGEKEGEGIGEVK